MLCVYIPNKFLAMKCIFYSKLGYIYKKMNITCNAGPTSLVLPRIFLLRFVLPLYLKVRRMVTVLLSPLTLWKENTKCLQYPLLWKYLQVQLLLSISTWYVLLDSFLVNFTIECCTSMTLSSWWNLFLYSTAAQSSMQTHCNQCTI